MSYLDQIDWVGVAVSLVVAGGIAWLANEMLNGQ